MIVVVDLSNLVWSTFYNSLKPNRIEVDKCPIFYQGHLDYFHQRLVRILQDQPCHEYIFALDRKPVKKFRIYSDYKKSRNRIKFDPKPAVMNMLVEWGSKVIYSEDNEADDAIASFVGSNIDKEITIATTDKDLWQLCEIPHVKVYNFQKGKFVTKNELKESFELDDYTHIKLHKALWGDTSDNVPNLAPRLGRTLLPVVKKTDGSLRDFWDKVEDNKSSLTEKCLETLDANKEKIRINYELVRLNFDCDVIFEVAKLPPVKEKNITQEITDEMLDKIFK